LLLRTLHPNSPEAYHNQQSVRGPHHTLSSGLPKLATTSPNSTSCYWQQNSEILLQMNLKSEILIAYHLSGSPSEYLASPVGSITQSEQFQSFQPSVKIRRDTIPPPPQRSPLTEANNSFSSLSPSSESQSRSSPHSVMGTLLTNVSHLCPISLWGFIQNYECIPYVLIPRELKPPPQTKSIGLLLLLFNICSFL
jgi:hypothetical protein